jgi:hypothetical protein
MIESYNDLCEWFDENMWWENRISYDSDFLKDLDSSYAIYEINQLIQLILDTIKREEEEYKNSN